LLYSGCARAHAARNTPHGRTEIVDVRLVNRLVRALGPQPSTSLGEPESPFLTWNLQKIREAVSLLYDKFVRPEQVRPEPKRVAKRFRAGATPDRETFHDDDDVPEREIPAHYAGLGAKYVFKAEGDSMIDVGITNRDIVFVRPEADPRSARGKAVVCRVGGSEYIKILHIERGRIHLLSANERFKPRSWTRKPILRAHWGGGRTFGISRPLAER
jgi:hypothetical protein